MGSSANTELSTLSLDRQNPSTDAYTSRANAAGGHAAQSQRAERPYFCS
jgi:hypothetical protein